MDKQSLIQSLQLEPHIEGGYFRRTYSAQHSVAQAQGQRQLMSSIFYMLTDDRPIGYFHRNQSDIIHYWHGGSALSYLLIDQHGNLSRPSLGPNLDAGEQLQLIVPGGYWKATVLEHGDYGLLSEAVTPGFDYSDMTLATAEQMRRDYPELWAQTDLKIADYCRSDG